MICHLHYCNREECVERHGVASGGMSSCGVASPAVITFKPAVFEHMYSAWETPRVMETPQQLREECNRRGLTSEYLRDSGLWRSGPDRWI